MFFILLKCHLATPFRHLGGRRKCYVNIQYTIYHNKNQPYKKCEGIKKGNMRLASVYYDSTISGDVTLILYSLSLSLSFFCCSTLQSHEITSGFVNSYDYCNPREVPHITRNGRPPYNARNMSEVCNFLLFFLLVFFNPISSFHSFCICNIQLHVFKITLLSEL